MWKTVQNSNDVKPDEIDKTLSNYVVYVRKNFEQVEITDEQTEEARSVWQYEENEIPKEDYELYTKVSNYEEQIIETEQMLTDLDISNIELSARLSALEGGK